MATTVHYNHSAYPFICALRIPCARASPLTNIAKPRGTAFLNLGVDRSFKVSSVTPLPNGINLLQYRDPSNRKVHRIRQERTLENANQRLDSV